MQPNLSVFVKRLRAFRLTFCLAKCSVYPVLQLRRRAIVVIDNVSFHKVAGVQESIEAGGAGLRYLPEYSPDLNPIELVFHPPKALLRKVAERTVNGVERVRSLLHSRSQTFRMRKPFQALHGADAGRAALHWQAALCDGHARELR
jgi:hypothetical protein